MRSYWLKNWGPKLRTFSQTKKRIANWPTVVGMRFHPDWQGLRLLHFHSGLNLICRGGTQDWDVISELAINDGYALALAHLRKQPGQPLVLDLGANIGVFSLLAAQACPRAEIHAYEPAPANVRMVEMHLLANDSLQSRIQLVREAVGGTTRAAEFFYDASNPQASRLEAEGAASFQVNIRAFSEIVKALSRPVALVKMDIEWAEYEVLQHTPKEVWDQVAALAVELHPNPQGSVQMKDFLERMRELGFCSIIQEEVGGDCYFLGRNPVS